MSGAEAIDIRRNGGTERAALDVGRIRDDFPILNRTIHGKPLIYLDSSASAQKPRAVLDAIRYFYEEEYSNIHRGVHQLSQLATKAYEDGRDKVQRLINAASRKEIVFVRGATEAINLVASSYGRPNLTTGDEILITAMEHHSNIVPWQLLCEQTGARLRVAPINDDGELIFEEFERLLGPQTKIVSVVHVSNALGTVNPVQEIIAASHEHGAVVLIDGAQAVPHTPVDVRELDCDFYAFSGHKLYGPSGIGILYGKAELLEAMPPYQGGGDMIFSVSFDKTVYNDLPYKFEAGTPNIVGAVGLGAAIDYVSEIGLDTIAAHEDRLLRHGQEVLSEIPGLRFIGTAKQRVGLLSFVLDGVHAHDIGTILDNEGIAVRTGHHCAQPVMERFGVAATARASFGIYNTAEEIDALAAGLRKVIEVFA